MLTILKILSYRPANEITPPVGTDLNSDLDRVLAMIINKIFRSQTLVNSSLDVNQLLIQLIDIIKVADPNRHSDFLNESLFSMVYNLTRQKIKSNRYIDLCILSDIADCLVDYLGKMDQINTASFKFDYFLIYI